MVQKTTVWLPETKLIGIAVRTDNASEMGAVRGRIFPLVQRYFHSALWKKMVHRKKPGVTYCVYTEYESDCTGAYTYFIGEEVLSFEGAFDEFVQLIVPAQEYAKFTAGPGKMPDVLASTWQKIWSMSPEELGGKRAYKADFEIYDERASDHQNIVFDVYVGID